MTPIGVALIVAAIVLYALAAAPIHIVITMLVLALICLLVG